MITADDGYPGGPKTTKLYAGTLHSTAECTATARAPLAMATSTSVLWNTLSVAMTAGFALPALGPKSELGLLSHGWKTFSGRLLLVYGCMNCIPFFVQSVQSQLERQPLARQFACIQAP